ncbi:MAG: MarR family transcriptional regulator, partial [Chloroflexi bacterium]|nr:MarR family transcriptional regulator [Chloroflexota bacterium]
MTPKEIGKADYEAMAQYRYAIRRFLRFSEEIARAAGVTPQQYQMLLAIKGYPGREHANISELAERMQLDHHSTVGLVDRTAERGLVRREHDEEDRRQVNVHLTAAGEGLLNQLAREHRQELRRMRQDLRPPGFGRRRPAAAKDGS